MIFDNLSGENIVDMIKLLEMIYDYDGFNSKLKLQKAFYCAMDNIRNYNRYKFIDYKFGPFSFEMHDQIQALYEINWINQEQFKHFGRIEVNLFEINKAFFNNFNAFIEFLKKRVFLIMRLKIFLSMI